MGIYDQKGLQVMGFVCGINVSITYGLCMIQSRLHLGGTSIQRRLLNEAQRNEGSPDFEYLLVRSLVFGSGDSSCRLGFCMGSYSFGHPSPNWEILHAGLCLF